MRERLAGAAVGVLFAAQAVWIATGPLRPHSYGNWAPFHEHATYTVDARIDGVRLDPAGVRARYGCYAHFYDAATDRDWQLNRMQHVLGWIERVERSSAHPAEVRVRYRIDGGPEQLWEWP
ncbi:MAG: hypothetical protein H6737_14640 [Alphaproteobacteria bacterium]|nr:hypothetical protein [Alphaproteobacteria bacterium]